MKIFSKKGGRWKSPLAKVVGNEPNEPYSPKKNE